MQESTTMLAQIREKLQKLHLSSLLVQSPANRLYLTGFTGSYGWVAITESEAILAVDSRYMIQAKQQCRDFTVVEVASFRDWWQEFTKNHARQRIGFESQHITHAQLASLRHRAIKLVATKNFVEELRLTKTRDELSKLKRAQRLTDQTFGEFLTLLRPGMSEEQIAWLLEKLLHEAGAQRIAWYPFVVAVGENSASPHHPPGKRKLAIGDLLQLDFGCVADGYSSDMSRVIFAGSPTSRQQLVYLAVLETLEYAKSLIKPGGKVAEVDKKARQFLRQKGFSDKEIYRHALGHGVGLEVHEQPVLSQASKEKFTIASVVTIEPGIYIPGWGGVRLEDEVVVTASGCQTLTQATKEISQIII